MGSWIAAGVAAENGADSSRRIVAFSSDRPRFGLQTSRRVPQDAPTGRVGKPVDIVCGHGALPVQHCTHKMLWSSRKIPLDGEVVSGIPEIPGEDRVST